MNTPVISFKSSFKVSYYTSYKDWRIRGTMLHWPSFILFSIPVFAYLFAGDSSIFVFSLFATTFLSFFLLFATMFYTNAVLTASANGLEITRKPITITYRWSDISKVELLTLRTVPSYLEILLAIYINGGNIDYIFIDSFYFKSAKSRLKGIQQVLENLTDSKYELMASDFEHFFLDKKWGLPRVARQV